jgi:Gas vesicle synthesis protein GvpL/GvpF
VISAAVSALAEDEQTSELAYVYGVVRSGSIASIDAEGIGGGNVELVPRDGVTALATFLPPGAPRVRPRDLHRHLAVLQDAFAATTILPCPFGTVVEAEELRGGNTLLNRHEDELDAELDRLNGFVQMNVKAEYDDETMLREIVAADPEIARLRSVTQQLGEAGYYERLRLGELVAAAVHARRERDSERLVDTLAGHAVEVVVDEPGGDGALKASFLVARERLATFESEVEKLARAEQPRLGFEVIGPLPPSAFVSRPDRR